MTNQPTQRHSLFARILRFLNASEEGYYERRETAANLLQTQTLYSTLTPQFLLVLALACLIATLGLLADSNVAIVGAMLIAPLMKPIMAFAYGLVAGNYRLKWRSLITLVAGMICVIVLAAGTNQLLGLRELTNEIVARSRPSLIDLGIAIAAGIASAMAAVRRDVADTLPGVAISVSLVPPLCVAGIAYADHAFAIGNGAFLLFTINLVAIILAAALVFLLDGYGSWRTCAIGLGSTVMLAALLTIPLTQELRTLRIDDLAQEVVEAYLHETYAENQTIHPDDLSQLDTLVTPDHIFIFLELKAPQADFGENQLATLQERLSIALGTTVNLKVQLLLTNELRLYPHRTPDGSLPTYGTEDFIPRR